MTGQARPLLLTPSLHAVQGEAPAISQHLS